jgi:hypothetical protein
VDQLGDVVKTYPGENLLPYTHWLNIKGKDERWKFLSKYNAIPGKAANRKFQVETKGGIEPRMLDEDELYDYADRAGTLFSNAVVAYKEDTEKVSKRGSEIIERTKANGDIEKISGIRIDMEKLWERAKDDAETELFRWGSVKEDMPKVWDMIKKNQAYYPYQTSKKTGDYNWTKSELYEFNNLATIRYATKMENYLSSDATVAADKKIINKEGVSRFDKKMKKEWDGLSSTEGGPYEGAREWAARKMEKRIKASIREAKTKEK